MFNEDQVYNFYEHTVTASFGITSIEPTSTASGGGRPQFYFAIGMDSAGRYDAVRMDDGFNFALELVDDVDGDFWRLFYAERDSNAVDGKGVDGVAANLSGLPTGIIFTLDGFEATIDITGATFGTTGSAGKGKDADTITIDMADYSANISEYNLAFGALNRINLDSGAETEVILNSFEVTVVPEPGTYALLLGCLALSSVMLRRRRF